MSRFLYLLLVLAVVAERIFELRLARRNAEAMKARGGREVGRGHYPWMVLLHSGLLLACPLEVFLLSRPFVPALGGSMLVLLSATMGLRYWAIRSLGDRWTTRIVIVPDEAAVRRGPYLFLRHPNYLAVVLEIAALPLVHTAYLTAAIGTVLNAGLLTVRIGTEERALEDTSDYRQVFGAVPRLLRLPGRTEIGRGRKPQTDDG